MALMLHIHMDNDTARVVEPAEGPVKRWQWQAPGRVDSETIFTREEFGFGDDRYELGQRFLDAYGHDNLLVLRLGDVEVFGHGLYQGGFKEGSEGRLAEEVGKHMFRFPRQHIALLLQRLCDAAEGMAHPTYTYTSGGLHMDDRTSH